MLGYSYPALIFKFIKARKYTQEDFAALQSRKLKVLVSYARRKSPFFKELYKSVPKDFSVEDLPVVDKTAMMSNFDDYVTDRKVRMADIRRFISDTSNIGRDFLGKYLVATTSGSTGVPSVVLHDGNSLRAASIMTMARYMKFRFPLAAFCVDDVFLIENGNIRSNIRKMPFMSKRIFLVDAKASREDICERVNKIRPKVIVGYAGSIELLADEALAGNISIKPAQILTSGEYLTPATRAKIKRAFPRADVRSIYGCTEGNVIAYECSHRHMHVNDDYFIVEPVDALDRPVQDGVISDSLLLTCLSNFVQPIIRFRMTDRIIMHHDPCPCGRCGAWFEVEGRSNDVLVMKGSDGSDVRIAPIPLTFVVEPIDGINNFQLVLHGYGDIELRIDFLPGADRAAVFKKAEEDIIRYLHKFGVDGVTVTLSDLLPQRSPRTGKFRQIYQDGITA